MNAKEREESKDNLELAEQHVRLAESLVVEEARRVKGDEDKKKRELLTDTAFSLEKAEAGLGDFGDSTNPKKEKGKES